MFKKEDKADMAEKNKTKNKYPIFGFRRLFPHGFHLPKEIKTIVTS